MDKHDINDTYADQPRVEKPAEVRSWLVEEFAARLAATLGGITGQRHPVDVAIAAESPKDGALCWRQPFNGAAGAMWIVAEEESWRNAGGCAMRAAELNEGGTGPLKAGYLEIVRQTASGIAQALTQKFGVEITPVGGEQAGSLPNTEWGAVQTTLAGAVARITVGFEPELLGMASSSSRAPLDANGEHTPEASTTFDLLLDVKLPVSISFGRAQVALKDVLKLTVGSIVELNRDISDPVEVMVNNCVIARGEVVVVEGNFGVRIQNVISTQERLRTLD